MEKKVFKNQNNWGTSSSSCVPRSNEKFARSQQKYDKTCRKERAQNCGASGSSLYSWNGHDERRPSPRGTGNQKLAREMNPEVNNFSISKKANLNHLLNFTFSSRHVNASELPTRKKNTLGSGGGLRFNKEQYLQANCQFVVKFGEDYTMHFGDSDLLVEWSLVEQIRLTTELPTCPICLYPPVAGKITRCGHIYCSSCVLHYLSIDNDRHWKKCPICFESIYQKDLKSVIGNDFKSLDNDESHQMSFVLMKREKVSMHSTPAGEWTDNCGIPCNIGDVKSKQFEKLLTATAEQILEMVENEKQTLLRQVNEEGDSIEGSYAQAALNIIEKRLDELKNEVDEEKNGFEMATTKIEDMTLPLDTSRKSVACCNDEEKDGFEMATIKIKDMTLPLDTSRKSVACCKHEEKKYFYFYQVEDGRPIFLQPLNAKMLLHEYGNWESCPRKITVEAISQDELTMNSELREVFWLRHLSHLPMTCQFLMVEVHLTESLVSAETQCEFAPIILKRQKARMKKQKEENRRLKIAREREERKEGRFPELAVNLDSLVHFPAAKPYSLDSIDQFPMASPSPLKCQFENDHSCLEPARNDLDNSEQIGSPSFASLLHDQPVSPTWVKKPLAGVEADEVAAPEFQDSFCSAFQKALDDFKEDGKNSKSNKKKKRLIFATGLGRSK